MPTGLTYATYQTQIATMAVVAVNDVNFQAILPAMIDYAELRIYRDLDLLSTTMANSTFAFTANNRRLKFDTSQFITVQEANVLTPVGMTNADSGTRNQLLPVAKEFLNAVYTSSAGATVPQYFAPFDQSSIIVGPWPDQNYNVELVGTIRPITLGGMLPAITSATVLGGVGTLGFASPHLLTTQAQVTLSGFTPSAWNGTFTVTIVDPLTVTIPYSGAAVGSIGSGQCTATLMSLQLDDVLIMASMVYVSSYQRNFSGSSSNDPGMPVNYEQQYQALMKSGVGEEYRKKFSASGWTAISSSPAATTSRG